MGIWSFYFFAKLMLYVGGYIGFHWQQNLLFALFLLLPWPAGKRRWAVLRQLIVLPLAIALLYHDSWLPPPDRVISQIANLDSFSPDYLVELSARFVKASVVAGLLAAFVVYLMLGSRLRLSSFAVLAILAVPIGQQWTSAQPAPVLSPLGGKAATVAGGPVGDAELNTQLSAFFAGEAKREVRFDPTPELGQLPFDVIVLHVCSLSWDDLSFVDLRNHPLFNQFDLVFDNFNSATAYSGPSAIRLLRGNCGQASHEALYQPAAENCYLFNGLERAGFEPQMLLNHDGRFDRFLATVRDNGATRARLIDNRKAPLAQRAFDGTPIYDDYSLLAQWWDGRVKGNAPPAALYYNTISLHDGNRSADGGGQGSLETYRPRAEKLLGDISRFLTLVASSGRPALVVFVPEHGAGLRGDKMQIAGMREIPSPGVSHVPVGIKLAGHLNPASGGPYRVTTGISYLGLAHTLASLTRIHPFKALSIDYPALLADLPASDWVSQNEAALLMRRQGRYFVRTPEKTWVDFQP